MIQLRGRGWNRPELFRSQPSSLYPGFILVKGLWKLERGMAEFNPNALFSCFFEPLWLPHQLWRVEFQFDICVHHVSGDFEEFRKRDHLLQDYVTRGNLMNFR